MIKYAMSFTSIKNTNYSLNDTNINSCTMFQELQEELRKKGHVIKYDQNPLIFTSVQSILVDNGEIKGYADPRKTPGKASYVYNLQ